MDRKSSLAVERRSSTRPAAPNDSPGALDRFEEPEDQSTVELVKSVLVDARELISKEIASARLELEEGVARGKRAAMAMGVAALVLLLGALLLSMALGFGLSAAFGLGAWAGLAIVGVVFALVGLVLYGVGRRQTREMSEAPARAASEIKQDIRWIKEEAGNAHPPEAARPRAAQPGPPAAGSRAA